MKTGDFPLQKDCDPKNPDEFAVWALVALPHMKGAALPFSSEYLQLVSRRIWNAGFRWHRARQVEKYRPPSMGDPHWLTNPGRWVPMNEPEPEMPEINQVALMKAMREADEKGFFEALNEVANMGKQ